MREIHKSNKDKRLERENIKLIGQIQGYEDSKPEYRDPKAYKKFKAAAGFADYEDLEEQGLLLRLPISEDAPVYSIEYCCGKNKSNRSGMCFRGFCENCSDKAYYIRESVAKQCSICEINKSVFFTREEAEAKLKEMEKKDV